MESSNKYKYICFRGKIFVVFYFMNIHFYFYLYLKTSTSMKTVFDNWNIQTQVWLRRIAYDRLSTGKTLGVFVLSAFWHGFYPGYYMTFVLAAFSVYAGRGVKTNQIYNAMNKDQKYQFDVLIDTINNMNFDENEDIDFQSVRLSF